MRWRIRMLMLVASPEAWLAYPVLGLLVLIATLLVYGALARLVPVGGWFPWVAAPLVFGAVVWFLAQRRKPSEERIERRADVMRDVAREVHEIPLDQARGQAHRIVTSLNGESHDKSVAIGPESERWLTMLHSSVRDILGDGESIVCGVRLRIGLAWIGPSRFVPGYICIGHTNGEGNAEFVVKANEPVVYEIDAVGVATSFFDDTTHFPSIYHLLIFKTQTFLCPQCGYDLRQTPTRCPECGREFPWNVSRDSLRAGSSRALSTLGRGTATGTRSRTRWLKAYVCALCVCAAPALLGGEQMPAALAWSARSALLVLLVPWLLVVGYGLYIRFKARETFRAMFDAAIELSESGDRFRAADLATEVGLSRKVWARRTADAVACGAVKLGDLEWVGKGAKKAKRSFYRDMAIEEGMILLSFGEVRYSWVARFYLWAKGREGEAFPVTFYSRLTDGRMVRTSNQVNILLLDIPETRSIFCLRGETLTEMLAEHRRAIEAKMADDPTVEAVRCVTQEQSLEAGRAYLTAAGRAVRENGILTESRAEEWCRSMGTREADIFREELAAARERLGCRLVGVAR